MLQVPSSIIFNWQSKQFEKWYLFSFHTWMEHDLLCPFSLAKKTYNTTNSFFLPLLCSVAARLCVPNEIARRHPLLVNDGGRKTWFIGVTKRPLLYPTTCSRGHPSITWLNSFRGMLVRGHTTVQQDITTEFWLLIWGWRLLMEPWQRTPKSPHFSSSSPLHPPYCQQKMSTF